MVSEKDGWLCNQHQIWTTADGGTTWHLRSVPAVVPLGAHVVFRSVKDGFGWWLSAGSGPLYVTTDGSQKWSLIPLESDGPVDAAWFPADTQNVFLGGGIYKPLRTGDAPNFALRVGPMGETEVLHPAVRVSADGGHVWETQQLPDCSYFVKEIRFWSNTKGYALGDSCFFYTSDRGKTWGVGTLPAGEHPGEEALPVSVFFLDSTIGWMNFSDGSLVETHDAGHSWQFKSYAAALASQQGNIDLKFVDETHGFAIGRRGDIYETFDAGKTWVQLPVNFLARTLAVYKNTVWFLSDDTLYTLSR
jgi:photosystem II stability/assembly factor-like uncharacterized protein